MQTELKEKTEAEQEEFRGKVILSQYVIPESIEQKLDKIVRSLDKLVKLNERISSDIHKVSLYGNK